MFKKVFLAITLLPILFPRAALPARAEAGPVTSSIARLGTGIPTSIAASPFGQALAVGASIGVWFLDPASLQPFDFWEVGAWVNAVEYSADGRYLRVNDTVYNPSDGSLAGVEIEQIAWANHLCTLDGQKCAQPGNAAFIITGLPRPVRILTDWVSKDATWSLDGRTLYGVVGGEIRAWEAASRRQTKRLRDFFTGELRQVLWSADGAHISSGTAVWDVDNAQVSGMRRCPWENREVFDCKPSALSWSGQRVRLNLPGRAARSFEPHHVVLTDAELSSDGRFIATSGGDVLACYKAKDGHGVYDACSVTAASVRIWDVQSFTPLFELPTVFYNLNFSPDGTLLIGHTQSGIEVWDWFNRWKVWEVGEDLGDQCPLASYGYYYWCRQRPGGMLISPNGHYAASYGNASTGSAVRLYRVSSGELVTTFAGHTALVTGGAFSLDGSRLAASSLDGTILIWAVPPSW